MSFPNIISGVFFKERSTSTTFFFCFFFFPKMGQLGEFSTSLRVCDFVMQIQAVWKEVMINRYDQRFTFLRREKIGWQSTEEGKRRRERGKRRKHFVHCCLQALCLTETHQTMYRKTVCLFAVRNTELNVPSKATWEQNSLLEISHYMTVRPDPYSKNHVASL